MANFKTPSHLNPNWSIRLNDLMSLVGQGSGSGRTMWSEGDKPSWTSTDPYWRTEEGRQWINIQALGGKDLNSIVSEMQKIESSRNATAGSNDTTSDLFTATIGFPKRGAFTAMAPQIPQYSPVQLPSIAPAPSVKKIDYVKLLRGRLVNSLFKDLI